MYPNPTDPLNSSAAALMIRNLPTYEKKVREHVARNAMREDPVSDIERDDLSELSDTSDIDPELL
jgi:ubiquitin-conjugating enzyme E2 H